MPLFDAYLFVDWSAARAIAGAPGLGGGSGPVDHVADPG